MDELSVGPCRFRSWTIHLVQPWNYIFPSSWNQVGWMTFDLNLLATTTWPIHPHYHRCLVKFHIEKNSIDLESWRFFMNKKNKNKAQNQGCFETQVFFFNSAFQPKHHDNRPPSHKSPWYEEPHAPSDIGRHGHSYCASKPRDGWLDLFHTTGRYGEMQCLNGDLLNKDMG